MRRIKARTKFNVYQMGKDELDENYLMTCFMEGYDDEVMIISAPFVKGSQFSIPDNMMLLVTFFDAHASYSLEAVVLGRTRTPEGLSLRLKQITDVKRTQRREDFRLEYVESCAIDKVITDDDGARKIIRLKSVTIDISGGGASIRLNESMTVNEVILLYLQKKNGDILKIPCEVRWAYQISDTRISWKYNLGIKFLFKNTYEKEQFVKYVFELARIQRQKGT